MSSMRSIGLAVGQTCTPDTVRAVEEAGYPDAAKAEIWPGRTLNKAAVKTIADSLDAKPAANPPKKKTAARGKKDGGSE